MAVLSGLSAAHLASIQQGQFWMRLMGCSDKENKRVMVKNYLAPVFKTFHPTGAILLMQTNFLDMIINQKFTPDIVSSSKPELGLSPLMFQTNTRNSKAADLVRDQNEGAHLTPAEWQRRISLITEKA